MSGMRADQISLFLEERVNAGDFPSAVYLVAEKGEIVFQDALGYAVVEPERIEARLDTIYDLASLTKPLVTGLLATILIERGELDPNDPIGDLLPEFHVSANAEISINQLLMHISGLPAWRPFYLLVEHPEEIGSEIARTMQREDQEPVTYSDLNFLTLELVLEKYFNESIDNTSQVEIFDPLNLSDTWFNPLPDVLISGIAASEHGNEYEKQTCLEQGYLELSALNGHFRDHLIWGEVHDGNAWFMGGTAGHAGLFSTAEDVFKIALQFTPAHTTLLKPETTQLFSTNFTKGVNEDRSVAFQLASSKGSTAGGLMSQDSFGHNGFTGTSLWIDPIKDRIFVLLTNRTHGHTLPFVNINSVRRGFHDLAIEILENR